MEIECSEKTDMTPEMVANDDLQYLTKDKIMELCAKYKTQNEMLKRNIEKEQSLRKEAEKELLDYKKLVIDKLQEIFNEDQISQLMSSKKWEWWSPVTYHKSFQILYTCGKTGYNFLVDKLKWPLPSHRSILRYLQSFKLTEGVSNDIFQFLRAKMDQLGDIEKNAGILFDEMAIHPGRRFDCSTESFVGADELKKGLLFLLRGISTKWKFAASYNFTKGSSDAGTMKANLFELIKKSEEAMIRIRFQSSDMGDDNIKLWKELGVTEDAPYYQNPIDRSRKIYVFADIQHAFKNLTQGLTRYDKLVFPKEMQSKYKLPTNEVKIAHIRELFEIDEDHTFRMTPKVRDFMFHQNGFQKMRVKNNTHLISHEVATALKFICTIDSKNTSFLTTAWFIEHFAYWYKVLTSRSVDLCLSYLDTHMFNKTTDFLKEMIYLFKKMRYCTKEGKQMKLRSQTGAIMSTTSYICLSKELLDEGFRFVMGSRFSTDAVENIFSVIRMSNCKPDAVQFVHILR